MNPEAQMSPSAQVRRQAARDIREMEQVTNDLAHLRALLDDDLSRPVRDAYLAHIHALADRREDLLARYPL